MSDIKETQKRVHELAKAKGWWPDELTEEQRKAERWIGYMSAQHARLSAMVEAYRKGTEVPCDEGRWPTDPTTFTEQQLSDLAKMSLIHSEVSEAAECIAAGDPPIYHNNGKPEGFLIELADVVIRIMDFCGRYDLDLDAAIAEKTEYNESRPERHGGKLA